MPFTIASPGPSQLCCAPVLSSCISSRAESPSASYFPFFPACCVGALQVHALQRFEQQLAGRRMNPNELAACLKLLAYLCSRPNAGDAAYLAAARRSHSLLVPTAAGLLMPATRVVHVGGSGGGVAAARLLGRADPQHLVLAHPQISDHICRYAGGAMWLVCMASAQPVLLEYTAHAVFKSIIQVAPVLCTHQPADGRKSKTRSSCY
jgi:hypothetical protein